MCWRRVLGLPSARSGRRCVSTGRVTHRRDLQGDFDFKSYWENFLRRGSKASLYCPIQGGSSRFGSVFGLIYYVFGL